MSLKNAALLALVGMVVLTLLLVGHLVVNIWGVLNGVVPAIRLLTSLVYVLASVGVTVFFYVFNKTKS
jgi:hypothetical protein